MTVDGSHYAKTLMSDLQLMSSRRLLVGGSEDTVSLTGRVMRNNFYGTIDKVASSPFLVVFIFSVEKGWLGSRVVSVLDSGAEGPGLKSQSRCCRVTVLGKLFTPIVPLFTKQQTW